jgi:hypothetical protein
MTKNKQRNHTQQSTGRRLKHHLLSLFVPRAHNGYHPHLINRYGLAVMLLLGLAALGASLQQPHSVLGSHAGIQPSALLHQVNSERTKSSHSPLVLSEKLSLAAQEKGRDMLENQYWAHTSPSGVTSWRWINEQGYQYAYAGENLARNFANAEATVAAWMASSSHRKNLLHSYYTEVGFGIVDGQLHGRSSTIIVALFATPSSSLAADAEATRAPPTGTQIGWVSRVGVAVQSFTPAVIGAMTITILGIMVAGVTFISTHLGAPVAAGHRANRISRGVWHQHHTISKMIGMGAFVVICTILFAGGSL